MNSFPKHSKCRFKTYPLIISAAFLIFACTNLFLFYFLYTNPQNLKAVQNLNWHERVKSLLSKNFNLKKDEWRLNPSKSSEASDAFELNCSTLQRGQHKEFVAGGWTKATHHMVVDGRDVAVKYVNLHGHDISNCMSRDQETVYNCYMSAASKLINEIIRMNILKHPNVIKLLGYCIPNMPDTSDGKWISIITELGEPINTIRLLLMSWEERLKVSLELARLVHHLSNSPLGSVALNDFRRQQFVFVRGDLKLIDVDDIGVEDPTCRDSSSCCINLKNASHCVPCTNHVCKGYNEKLNILSAGRHFINHILPHEVPSELKIHADEINQAYQKATWTSKKILRKTEDLTLLYMKGLHRNITL